jgi:hypothetical protein
VATQLLGWLPNCLGGYPTAVNKYIISYHMGLYRLRQHKPCFNEECSQILRSKEAA